MHVVFEWDGTQEARTFTEDYDYVSDSDLEDEEDEDEPKSGQPLAARQNPAPEVESTVEVIDRSGQLPEVRAVKEVAGLRTRTLWVCHNKIVEI